MKLLSVIFLLVCTLYVSLAISAETSAIGNRGKNLTAKQILDARSKYKVKVLSFDASKQYGSEFPFSDFVRLRVTNSSTVVLPFLTVRTNRFSKGKNVGWSRAPAIPVGDLKPGQSKEVDFYPRGHLDVVTIDRISIQIEKTISKENKQFYKELDQVH